MARQKLLLVSTSWLLRAASLRSLRFSRPRFAESYEQRIALLKNGPALAPQQGAVALGELRHPRVEALNRELLELEYKGDARSVEEAVLKKLQVAQPLRERGHTF